MTRLTKFTTIAAAVALTIQPSVATASGSQSATTPPRIAATSAPQLQFDLERHKRSAPIASMSLAASQQTAAEMQDQPKRKGPGATTLIVVGGVVLLLVLVVAAASSASPGPGPHEGAFD